MTYSAKILADSINETGARLTTLEVTFPRFVLAEMNTHRMLSRSSASSRAIPVEKRVAMVEANPFIPEPFGSNKKGMQAGDPLADKESARAKQLWLRAASANIQAASELSKLGVHKQLANRLLEPFLWHTAIISATHWENFFALRCHPDAQPEIRKAAELMQAAMVASQPKPLRLGEWHRPLMADVEPGQDGLDAHDLNMVSAGRCARVSYLTHDGKRDLAADVELARRILKSGHMSPFEHVATPTSRWDAIDEESQQSNEWSGNFFGWRQLRKTFPNENNFGRMPGSYEATK